MLFADWINDRANYILVFKIKLVQHGNTSSLYRDACAHRNSAYLVATLPQPVQQRSMPYIYTNWWYYSFDGLIRRYRVLALMVWGPLLLSPIIRARGGGVMIQTVEGSQFDVVVERQPHLVGRRSQLCEAIRVPSVCELLFQYLVLFTIVRHPLFYSMPRVILRM